MCGYPIVVVGVWGIKKGQSRSSDGGSNNHKGAIGD